MLIFCQRVKDENFLMVVFLVSSLRDPRTDPNQFLFVEGRDPLSQCFIGHPIGRFYPA